MLDQRKKGEKIAMAQNTSIEFASSLTIESERLAFERNP
jgi:hypothetical protein